MSYQKEVWTLSMHLLSCKQYWDVQPAAPVIDTYRYLIRLTLAVWCTNYSGPKFRLGSCCLFLGSLVKRVRHRQAPLLGLFILLSFPEAERSYLKTAPLLTSSPVKERPSSGIPSPAVRPQASPAALYSPLWLASSFYGLSKLSPLLGQHPFLLLQVYYCIWCISYNFLCYFHCLKKMCVFRN